MNYEAVQLVEGRIHDHEVKQKALKDMLALDLPPESKDAIRKERTIEDAVIEELQQLRRKMMQN